MPYYGRIHLIVKSNLVIEAKEKEWVEISFQDCEESRREIMNLSFVQEALIEARVKAMSQS